METNQPKVSRSPRAHKGQIMLTERDVMALKWIGEQYAIRLDHLQRLLGRAPQKQTNQEGLLHQKTAWRVMKRWETAGLIKTAYVLAGQPAWVWLTAKGLDEFGFPFKPMQPKVATIDHLYWTNQARMWVEERNPQEVWISERALKVDREARRRGVRHLADAEIVRSDEHGEYKIAIEVELTPKKPEDLEAIVRDLANYYVGVWYFTRPAAHQGVERAVNKLRESKEHFIIRPFDTLT